MNTIETALRSYRVLLAKHHAEELKQRACVDAALIELTALQATVQALEGDKKRLRYVVENIHCCQNSIGGIESSRWTIKLGYGTRDFIKTVDAALATHSEGKETT